MNFTSDIHEVYSVVDGRRPPRRALNNKKNTQGWAGPSGRVTPTPSPCKHPVSPPQPMLWIPCQERFGPLVHDLHLVPCGMGYSSSSRTDVARFLGTLCMNSLYSRHSSLGERFRVSTGATGRSVFNCRYIPLVVGISIKREILNRRNLIGRPGLRISS